MRSFQSTLMASSVLVGMIAAQPALACRDEDPIEPRGFLSADLVVVGHVTNYRVVKALDWRQKKQVDPAYNREFASDFVRFDVHVERVLSGRAPRTLRVAWDAGWMGEPHTLQRGPYVIGLRYPESKLPDTRPANLRDQEPILPTVISFGCGGDLLVESDSELGRKIRKLFTSHGGRGKSQ